MTRTTALLLLASLSTPALARSGSVDDGVTYRQCRADYKSDIRACLVQYQSDGNADAYDSCMDAAVRAFEACMRLVKVAQIEESSEGMTAIANDLDGESVDFNLIDRDGVSTFLGFAEVDEEGTAVLELGHDPQVRQVLRQGGRIEVQ